MKDKYERLLSEIAAQARALQRDPSEITLIAVTKYASLQEMKEAYSLGIRHFGEQRLQVALEKMPHFPKDVIWHFIGPLQSNKIGKIVEHFSYIHSVGSVRIAEAIAKKAKELSKSCGIFLQVNASKEETKQGFCLETFQEEYEAVLDLKSLNICGLMTMAPLTEDQAQIEHSFSLLQTLQKRLYRNNLKNREFDKEAPQNFCLERATIAEGQGASENKNSEAKPTSSKPDSSGCFGINPQYFLSMGMSHDFPLAIAHGATHLRIGSYLFGK